MINFKNETENNIWWIVKSTDNAIIHYGILEPEMVLESGQTIFDTYSTEEEWLNALNSLGITLNNNEE